MSDFIVYISIDKEVDNGVVSENRYIHFRSDGDIEAGSRFGNVPDKIEYDVELFVETFEKAVLSSYDGDEKAVKKAKEEQTAEREEKAKEYVETEKATDPKVLQDAISEAITQMTDEQQTAVKKSFKDKFGSINYKKYEVEHLEEALEIVNKIISAQ